MNNQNNKNNSNTHTGQSDFVLNLERASNTVKQWPEWKQNVWGPAITANKGCCTNNK